MADQGQNGRSVPDVRADGCCHLREEGGRGAALSALRPRQQEPYRSRNRNPHPMGYIANTPDDVRVMLGAIGLDALEQLFEVIPRDVRLNRPLQIPPALTELERADLVGQELARNQGADRKICFLGGGSYDHFIPSVVDHLASRGEFYTAYTPYQPE